MSKIAAIIGGGVIGGGWLARFLLNGWDINVFDPDPEAERKISEVLKNARHALPMLYDQPLPPEGSDLQRQDLNPLNCKKKRPAQIKFWLPIRLTPFTFCR